MSSEERWTRIENALQTVAERQALHEEHGRQTDQRIDTVTKNVGILAENMIVLVHKVDDLSDVVRSHDRRFEQLGNKIDVLFNIVQSHEGKIDVLVDTVDRIVRRDPSKA